MSAPLTVVVASSHAPTRAGVAHALEEHGLDVRGEASDAPTAVEMVADQSPDCCLIDAALAGDGLLAATEIARGSSLTAVVVLAEAPSEEELFAALHAGASGYVAKDVEPSFLAQALVDARDGVPAVPRPLLASLVDAFRSGTDGARPPLPAALERKLSRREREVLVSLEMGEPTGRIAARLSISPVTVRRHISAIIEKLGVPDRNGAVELLAAGRAARSPAPPRSRAGDGPGGG